MTASRLAAAALAAVLAAAGAAEPCAAQGPSVTRDCNSQVVAALYPDSVPEGWRSEHPDAVVAEYAPQLAGGRWSEVATTLAARYRATDVLWPGGVGRTFAAHADTLATELFALEQAREGGALARASARGSTVRRDRFDLVRDDENSYSLFNGEQDSTVVIDLALEPRVRRQLCWRALTLTRVINLATLPAQERAVAVLREKVERWGNYRRFGYSQYPWELFLNGRLPWRRNLEPPQHQVIFLHPAVGMEVAGPSFPKTEIAGVKLPRINGNDLRGLTSVWLEPLGYIRYRADRGAYYGGALLVTVPQGEAPGYGVAAHVYRFSLGYVRRGRPTDRTRKQSVVLSVDLYGLITRGRSGAAEGAP
jgi:hypothetical protein